MLFEQGSDVRHSSLRAAVVGANGCPVKSATLTVPTRPSSRRSQTRGST